MLQKHRVNILRKAKKNPKWCDNEGIQDKIIAEECEKRGYEFHDFYATDGKTLNKMFGV